MNMFTLELPIFGPCLQSFACKSNHCASSQKVIATWVGITSYNKTPTIQNKFSFSTNAIEDSRF